VTSDAALGGTALDGTAPARAALAGLSGLPGMGPNALTALLRGRSPQEAWAAVCDGRPLADPAVAAHLGRQPVERAADWTQRARRTDLHQVGAAHRAANVRLLMAGDDDGPERLDGDPEPPAVLCVRGHLDGLERPTCGIVGTRSCTPDGRRVAYALGRDLAAAGVSIVSGLALGIDAAAHRGCLAAEPSLAGGGGAPVGVVAAGLDCVYPPSHAELYRHVAESGVLLSEAPLGTRPDRWRFPARNRLIAALSDIVVVVESPSRGGSLHTVESALARSREVAAVPGPVLSAASEGSNRLLADGAMVVRGADDVLMALGLCAAGRVLGPGGARAVRDAVAARGPDAVATYHAVGTTPTTLESVVTGSGLDFGRAMTALQHLAAAGLVDDVGGYWSRAGRPA
jgi:DNA processing protein